LPGDRRSGEAERRRRLQPRVRRFAAAKNDFSDAKGGNFMDI
jgi:hypothetical protein